MTQKARQNLDTGDNAKAELWEYDLDKVTGGTEAQQDVVVAKAKTPDKAYPLWERYINQ